MRAALARTGLTAISSRVTSGHAGADGALNPGLIFDLGVNKGEDSAFYLDKGFFVVGVEANPVLADMLAQRFYSEIASGRYTLLNIGIWSDASTLTFYRNLDNDHWSSFDPAYGCRDGTRFDTVSVPTLPIEALFAAHGVPRYLKIDIEGADKLVLAALQSAAERPTFVSVEEYGVAAIDDLHAAGYRFFQTVPQSRKTWAVPPDPPREGHLVKKKFNGKDSGLFGEELPDAWLDYAAARAHFIENIREEDHTYVGRPGEWFDVHAKM